ncbi:radical SAM family heme chaperone HemW [bacterium]|nr:radical SAM family heme chaperone HemW [bacterium]
MTNTAALYLHIPFCAHKCAYCDFYSITRRELLPPFIDALLREITFYSENPPFGGFSISTLYLGGGTPSLLTPAQLKKVLVSLREKFTLAQDAEITLEANPGATERAHLSDYRRLGINRLSLGIQSFQLSDLALLSRLHTKTEAEQAIRQARQAGFDNLSLDLIFSVPGQTDDTWRKTLHQALAFQPEHLSCYSLTIEPGTPLHRQVQQGQVQPCAEELERELFILTQETLQQAGYEQYEISNYCLPGFRSRHNQAYWSGCPYLGLGPSAHSFDGHRRWWNVRDVEQYLQAVSAQGYAVADSETLTAEQKTIESVMLGLRRIEGVALVGLPFQPAEAAAALAGIDDYGRPFQSSADNKLITQADGRLALTREGLLLYNYVCEKLCSLIT